MSWTRTGTSERERERLRCAHLLPPQTTPTLALGVASNGRGRGWRWKETRRRQTSALKDPRSANFVVSTCMCLLWFFEDQFGGHAVSKTLRSILLLPFLLLLLLMHILRFFSPFFSKCFASFCISFPDWRSVYWNHHMQIWRHNLSGIVSVLKSSKGQLSAFVRFGKKEPVIIVL